MKKILSILSVLILVALSVHATGSIGPNPPQSGLSVFTNNVWTNTITFPYPFQTIPIINSYYVSGPTNVTPFTNALITTTNFNLEINSTNGLGTNAATSFNTNALIAWQAYVGGTRMESGILAAGSGGATTWTNTFQYPYAPGTTPVVICDSSLLASATNNAPAITSITSTNFIVSAGTTNQTIYWISIGTVANPQTQNSGSFPQNNTVLY